MPEFQLVKIDDHLSLKTEDRNNIAHIQVHGILESSNSQAFEKKVLQIIEKGKVQLVLGIGELSYVSSTGVGAFLKILKICQTNKGNAVIYNMPSTVKESFNLLGFGKSFNTFDNLEQAEKYLLK